MNRSFLHTMTVSGPYGQFTVEAVVDPDATFSSIPAPALIEMGVDPIRVVRVRSANGRADFAQLGRALTTVAGHEDVAPILFGEPGTPAVIGATTLAILLLEPDADSRQLLSVEASRGSQSAPS